MVRTCCIPVFASFLVALLSQQKNIQHIVDTESGKIASPINIKPEIRIALNSDIQCMTMLVHVNGKTTKSNIYRD